MLKKEKILIIHFVLNNLQKLKRIKSVKLIHFNNLNVIRFIFSKNF